MSKKVIHYLTYGLYVFVTVLFLVEASSQIYVRTFRSDLKNQKDREDYFRLNMVQDWDERFRTSPFFGYVLENENNYGFQTSENFPIKRNKDSFVIAIIGGSVANNFSTFIDKDPKVKDLFKKNVPRLANKDIQFINFAIPGYKQPQQYFVLSYFIDQIDYLIQLDGWNEAWVRTSHQFPADYPAFSEYLYSQQIGEKLEKLLAKKLLIDFLKNNIVLNKSMAVTLARSILQDDWNKLSGDLLVNNEKFFYKTHHSEEDLKNISIDAMVKYIKLEKNLLKMYNKKAYFFIQPSQYNPDSKTFSDWEKKVIFSTAENAKINAWAFQKVRAEATKLGSTDLAYIFKNELKSVYVDDCCHLNNLGNKIMADAIFSKVISDLNK